MSIADRLHDAIDIVEEHSDRARSVVERVVREKLQEAFDKNDNDFPGALRYLAEQVEDELADITTDVVHAVAKERRKL